MTKKYVLVEAIEQVRVRYVVELNEVDNETWALDDVVMGRVVKLSSQPLGEVIVSHRVLPGGLQEAVAMARADNKDQLLEKTDEEVCMSHITRMPT